MGNFGSIKNIEKNKTSENKADSVDKLVEKIILYISKNIKNDITLDVLAKEFSVSRYYISRIFSNTIKMSFSNYISLIRAEYAAGSIRSTDDSITNIYIIAQGFPAKAHLKGRLSVSIICRRGSIKTA